MRIYIIKKGSLIAALSVVAVAVMLLAYSRGAIPTVAAAKRQLPIYCVESQDKRASLSFDAAWGDMCIGTR